jgi:hypothetical protein
MAHFSNNPHE